MIFTFRWNSFRSFTRTPHNGSRNQPENKISELCIRIVVKTFTLSSPVPKQTKVCIICQTYCHVFYISCYVNLGLFWSISDTDVCSVHILVLFMPSIYLVLFLPNHMLCCCFTLAALVLGSKLCDCFVTG